MKKDEIQQMPSYFQTCVYDERRDAQKVVQGLGVNIDDMLQTGIVKNSSETLDNNGIDEPGKVIGRIRDVFDAMDAARIVKKYGRKAPGKVNDGVAQLVNNEE